MITTMRVAYEVQRDVTLTSIDHDATIGAVSRYYDETGLMQVRMHIDEGRAPLDMPITIHRDAIHIADESGRTISDEDERREILECLAALGTM